ncbi:MAG: beta 1-4 rhamnosyltransferase Cps2T [Acetivibrionales bacterium]|jgi:rhamnosyltransferase
MVNVFIVGSKGIPARYGGFESFVENLVREKVHSGIKYHVACLKDSKEDYDYCGARCFCCYVKHFGRSKAVIYDLLSLAESIRYIKKNKLHNSIIYILACRIGPFMWLFKGELKKMGIRIYINPDGHEWLRSKWNRLIRRYWKLSESLMVRHADLVICDSKQIEKYIKGYYRKISPHTIFIPYGADTKTNYTQEVNDRFIAWCKENGISRKEYYLMVGRFVPENNYETVIKEFMQSRTEKKLVIITNKEPKFYNKLKSKIPFDTDKRICFAGTVYDSELLKQIRMNAYAYIHGHEVGGTNPSLLESMAATDLNILLNVPFNQEVGKNAALYFNKNSGSLKRVLEQADTLSYGQIQRYGKKCKERIKSVYLWDAIIKKYEMVFLL